MTTTGKPVAAQLLGRGVLLATLAAWQPASAVEIDTGNSDLKVRWDNTLKYSAAWRVRELDEDVAGGAFNPNIDGGDHNFDRGLISNRFDILTEIDFRYKRLWGARLSGAAWYDSVYHDDTDSDLTIPNALSVPNSKFTKATKKLHGEKAELLDAFVFGRLNPAGMNLNGKLGQFTQLYGESLFFGANGVANAQVTPDIVKLLSVPNSQFKEILRPVEQAALSLQVNPTLTLGTYYQFEWEEARLPGAGSYFSFADFVGDGGEVVFFPDIFNNPATDPPLVLLRDRDIAGSDSGQFGFQLRYRHEDTEYGIYASRHHDKVPQFYFRPVDGGPSSYALVFAEDIETYGLSLSTLLGEANVAGEVSYRRNTPFLAPGNVVLDFAGTGDGDRNPLYPVGKSLHVNLSAITVLAANPLWDGASFVGEMAFNRRLSIDKNAGQLDPNATRNALAVRFVFQPEYFQVVSGVDLQVPIGIGYGVDGRSSVLGAGAMPPEHGGDLSIGVKADYRKTWQASLNYTHYFGDPNGVVNSANVLSYDQMHRDRDFISVSIQRAF